MSGSEGMLTCFLGSLSQATFDIGHVLLKKCKYYVVWFLLCMYQTQ